MPRWDKKIRQARRLYRKTVENVRPEDVGHAASSGRRKIIDLADNPPGVLKQLWDDILVMIAMIRNYVKGDYRDVPWTTIATVTGAILYLANPLDIIPDFIPFAGYIDDAAVLGLALHLIRNDLLKFRDWRTKKAIEELAGKDIEDVDFEDIQDDGEKA